MRALSSPPASLFGSSGSPALGSFGGALPAVDWAPVKRSPLQTLREKRWVYVTLASDDLHAALAVVNLGFATKVFAFVFDKAQRRVVARESMMLPPGIAKVGANLDAHRVVDVHFGGVSVHLVHEGDRLHVKASLGSIRIDANVNDCIAPPSIGAIVDLGTQHFHATEKRTLASWAGSVDAGDEHYRADEGFAGFDFSAGFPHHRTQWRWAFLLGRTTGGEPIALNLVEGFVREAECAVWFRGAVHGVGEGRFAFDRQNPWKAWKVTTTDGAVDLSLIPCDLHEEFLEVGVLGVRYKQPIGLFSGTFRVAGESVEVERVVGVAEDQRVRW
jgi:hypothetical protein